jgi:hypothetical protein
MLQFEFRLLIRLPDFHNYFWRHIIVNFCFTGLESKKFVRSRGHFAICGNYEIDSVMSKYAVLGDESGSAASSSA